MQYSSIILASGSPRRRELLGRLGIPFTVYVSDVDENVTGRARDIVRTLAERKAQAVAKERPDALVIASDTLVSLDGAPLGKPADVPDARRMLMALSGREHEVYSGVCLMCARTGEKLLRVARTGVRFKVLSEKEIDDYIATGEPMDKAGAYGIQGGAGAFVSKLDGSFENVRGFPIDDVRQMLPGFGVLYQGDLWAYFLRAASASIWAPPM